MTFHHVITQVRGPPHPGAGEGQARGRGLHPGGAQGESGARGENREHASAIWNIRSRDQSRGQSRFSPDLSPEY